MTISKGDIFPPPSAGEMKLLNLPPVLHDGGHITHSHGHRCRTGELLLGEHNGERERAALFLPPGALALYKIQRTSIP